MNFTNALLVLILSALLDGAPSIFLVVVGVVMLILVPLLALDKSFRFTNRKERF